MSISDIPAALVQAESIFVQMLAQLAPMAQVLLWQEQQSFELKAFLVPKGDPRLTGGTTQERAYVLFHHASWLSHCAREPKVGDRLEIRGKRYAIQEAALMGGVDQPFAWQCWVQG